MQDLEEASFSTATTADRIGIGVSTVCLAHCLLLPILIATMPLWPSVEILHHWLHPVFALLVVPATIVAMRSGYRVHEQWHVPVLLGAGLGVLLIAGAWGHQTAGAITETALTFAGSLLLITGHLQNSRHGRRCRPCDDECKVC